MVVIITILLAIFILSLFHCQAQACTTILIGANLTEDNVIMHGHIEDMGINAEGEIWHTEETNWESGKEIAVPYVKISQPEKTIAYWASGNSLGTSGLGIDNSLESYNSVLVGVNQCGVCVSCNWCYSREQVCERQGIRRYALRQLILERAHSAYQGVLLLGEFMNQWGQADWNGLLFAISDARGGWIVEITTKHWVARRVRDDEIFVAANRFTIGRDFDLGSCDIENFSIQQQWRNEGDFSFCASYTLPERAESPYDVLREERIKDYLKIHKGRICVNHILEIFQDRYEGTKYFRFPREDVELWEKTCEEHNLPRPICTNLAQSFFVTKNAPAGNICFIGLGTPGYSGVVPLLPNSKTLPKEFSQSGKDSAWSVFRNLGLLADRQYSVRSSYLKNEWRRMNDWTQKQAAQAIKADAREQSALTFQIGETVLATAQKLLMRWTD